MDIVIGLLIIAIGAFCQSSSYVPINKVKQWSWESYWLVQGVFAWLIFPVLGALLAVPAGHSLFDLFTADNSFNVWMTMLFGVLWGVGGLTFGLSMRYLGVALGQSIALGTCAGLGTVMGPVLLNIFFPELDALSSLTFAVITGVAVTLLGIAVIGVAGSMKAASLSEEEKKAAEAKAEELKGFLTFVKDSLGEQVKEVRLSADLGSHPVSMAPEGGMSFEMEKYMKKVNPEFAFPVGRILELNPDHEAVKTLQKTMMADPVLAKDYVQLLCCQAQLMADLPLEDPVAYTDLVCKLIR